MGNLLSRRLRDQMLQINKYLRIREWPNLVNRVFWLLEEETFSVSTLDGEIL